MSKLSMSEQFQTVVGVPVAMREDGMMVRRWKVQCPFCGREHLHSDMALEMEAVHALCPRLEHEIGERRIYRVTRDKA